MTTTQQKQGFTIIEVVLVLAIAGLIFLMVFIALPALQRGQRDTARRSDVSTVSAAFNTFTTNNRGDIPNSAELRTQLGASGGSAPFTFDEVSNNTTNVTVDTSEPTAAVTVPEGTITVYTGMTCDSVNANGSVTMGNGTNRQYATLTRLEGGNSSGFCLDS